MTEGNKNEEDRRGGRQKDSVCVCVCECVCVDVCEYVCVFVCMCVCVCVCVCVLKSLWWVTEMEKLITPTAETPELSNILPL